MKHLPYIFTCILILTSCQENTSKTEDKKLPNKNKGLTIVQKKRKVNIKEIHHGYCENNTLVDTTIRDENSPTYKQHFGDMDFKAVAAKKSTSTIKIKKKASFGTVFYVECEDCDSNELIDMDITWTFPKGITNMDGSIMNNYTATLPHHSNDTTYSCYILEEDNEMIEGKWIFNVTYMDSSVFRKEFTLIP